MNGNGYEPILIPLINTIMDPKLISTIVPKITDDLKVSPSLNDERLAICNQCDYLRKPLAMLCIKCGCFAQVKAWLKKAKCPIGKW